MGVTYIPLELIGKPGSKWAHWSADLGRLVAKRTRGNVQKVEEREGVLWITMDSGEVYSAHRVGDDGFEFRLERADG